MPTRRLAALAAVLAAAVPAALAGPAGAATTARSSSSNWAGYAASRAGVRFRAVRASWVQPAVSCTATGRRFAAMWVGIGGYHTTSRALEQIGTEADCAGARPRYSAWYELVPAASVGIPMRVRPGDRLTASTHLAGRRVTVTLVDATRGTRFSRTLTARRVDRTSAEWIMEAPALCTGAGTAGCRVSSLADFGTARFTSAAATTGAGHTGAIADGRWMATAIDLAAADEAGGRRAPGPGGATTGALGPSGSAFSVTYAAPAPGGGAWTAPPSRFSALGR